MDKRFFKNWVLHIPDRLRDFLWIMSAWSSVAPIFSSLIMCRASSSCVCSSQTLLKVITFFWNTFLTWMNPMILGGYSRWPSPLLHASLLLLPLQVVLDLRDSYDCMVSSFWIFTFFNWFLKVMFWFLFFPSNSLVKESTSLVSLRKTFLVQVDPWLNQPWYSWPWPSSSCVRLLASSPSGTRDDFKEPYLFISV